MTDIEEKSQTNIRLTTGLQKRLRVVAANSGLRVNRVAEHLLDSGLAMIERGGGVLKLEDVK